MKEPDFELSADMRLLELQRGALGLPARERTGWESSSLERLRGCRSRRFGDDDPVAEGAMLTVDATAFPSDGVIPGAVVTLTLKIANEGSAARRRRGRGVPSRVVHRIGPARSSGTGARRSTTLPKRSSVRVCRSARIGPSRARDVRVEDRRETRSQSRCSLAPAVARENAAVIGARPLSIGRKATAGQPVRR